MRELMIHLQKKLSEYAPVYFEDMPREDDGSINMEGINIVYDLPSIGASDNLVKQEIPLTLDIWYEREKIYEVEDIVELIDKKLSNTISTLGSGSILKIMKQTIFYNNIKDPNPNIRRKRLNFTLHYYKY